MFLNYLLAEFKKTKHLQIRTAHIFIPVITAMVFFLYCLSSPLGSYVQAEAYFQVLAMGLPFLIGLFCAILAEQEMSAGFFWHMLSAPKRCMAFSSKLVLLILFGTSSVMTASVLFGTAEFFLAKQTIIDYSFYWISGLILAGTSVFLYVLHLFLALRFNKGVTTGLGIVESLLSALLITGLGDNIWMYIPAAWASRLITSLLLKFNTGMAETARYGLIKNNCICAAIICIITTVAALIAFETWAYNWDGAAGNE